MNAQNHQWAGGLVGAYEKPQGPADKVFSALSALELAIKEATAAGWIVDLKLDDDELHITASRQLIVKR